MAMKPAMVRHDEILEKTIAAHRGHVFARMGDGMAAAFATARDAVSAAAAIQQALVGRELAHRAPFEGTHRAAHRRGGDRRRHRLREPADQSLLPPDDRRARRTDGVSGATEMLMRGQLPAGMELVDLGEHRLRDLGQPTRIFQLIRDGDHEEFPPLRTLDSFPGNLPAQVSSFIGRKADVARVAKALDAVTGCDDHRGGRSWQDPLGITGCRRGAAPLSRRRVAGRACIRSRRRRCVSRRSRRCSASPVSPANRSRTPCSRCWLKSRCCWCWTTASTCSGRWPGS